MQNTSWAHRRLLTLGQPAPSPEANESRRVHARGFFSGVLPLLVLAAFILFPASALAKGYSMPEVDISIDVTDAGNVNFQEQRQFDFDGSFTCVWWTFGDLPENASIQVNGVSLVQGEADAVSDAASHAIPQVAFQPEWRSVGGPGGEAYSWDAAEDTLYVFFEASDESLVASIDYTVVNGISAYDDMGEFYWQYITDGWAEDSQDVTATVSLPVPVGAQVDAGQNVYAWGHGPLDGSVSFNDDGTVRYTVPDVPAGEYAEARVLFPVEWLTGLSESSRALHEGESILSDALDEEQGWADEANARRMQSILFIGVFLAISAALIGWAIVMFLRWGRELKPRFTDKYWRDVPDQKLSPAVVARLMRFDGQDAADFTATLMGLSAKGVLRIDKGSYPNKRGKMVDDYYLTLLPEAMERQNLDPVEHQAIDLVFNQVAGGANQVWFKSIELYGKSHADEFSAAMEKWQGVLTGQVNKAKLFEAHSESVKHTVVAAAFIYVVGMVTAAFWFENLVPLIPVLPTVVVLLVIAHFMSRRTQRGADVAARADALKRWLKDFTRLEERPPTDVKVWGQFMVYAFIFGIADEVLRDLRLNVPAFRGLDDNAFTATLPFYWWYVPGPGFGHHPAMAADLFDTTMHDTIQAVQAAASGVAGGFSGGGGGGGGFSGGGGGGFGGGGGGGAR